MFETYEAARIPASPFIQRDTSRWAFVMLSANDRWFYVTLNCVQNGETDEICQQQYLIPSMLCLLGLIRSDTADTYVASIQLVSPSWMNGSDEWRMQPIQQIMCLPSHASERYCYQLKNGDLYPAAFARLAAEKGTVVWPTKGGVSES
ncbi:Imm63 domain-containing protein [Pseudomonas sp. IT-P294]